MASHVALFRPGEPVTCTAAENVSGGRLVIVTGDREVEHATAAHVAVVGVSATDAAAGEKVAVLPPQGVHRILATGTVTAGNQLVAAANGTVAAVAAVTTPTPEDVTRTRAIVGTALTGGTNVPVEVLLG